MKRILTLLAVALSLVTAQAEPLRVFIRGGKKTHGPNAHEHERFLKEWTKLLTGRGMKVDGGMEFPTAEQLDHTDVLVMYAQDGGNIAPEQRPALEQFIRRGGGIVAIHTAAVANKPDTSPYWKSVIGGSWVQGRTKWKEGPMNLYYVESERIGGGHPITRGASNFKMDDEIYYDMDLSPDIRVLATVYTPNVKAGKKPAAGGKVNIYDIQPQMWVYERTAEGGTQPYRAFVSIPGHLWSTFERPNYRAILLRGIAWAGKRANVDEFCTPEELSSLMYPDGGPETPAQTLANLEVHPDFTMKIVASEPLITKPICINWDPAGRLWVAETPEYPNGRRGMRPDYRGKEWKDHGGIDPTPGEQTRKAQDRISILLDTNGDGVMDKKQVFYEGLELVTGFVFYKDGVIVTQAPDILFIHDPGPDGKARKVEKLYTGLGTRDTHAVINNPRWGWDGWIYATHGYSASSDVKNAKGESQGTIGSGVVRFRPDGSKIEQYSSKGGNTWGLTITADNRVMWTQPTSGQLLMQTVLPEDALARGKIGNTPSFNVVEPSLKTFPLISWEELPYVQIDWVGSFTAAAGCAIYDGGTWPAEYNGDYFTTEPTINIIHHARLTPQGSSYTFHKLPGREETEFVRSKDMWWRPIEVRIGPDGAMYVCDFYNQAVIHNDTRGPDHNNVNAAVRPDRDHYFGRIWKIDHKDAKKIAVPDLSKASVEELAKALEHPNKAVRMTASRLFVDAMQGELGRTSAAPTAIKIIEGLAQSGSAETKAAALWTLCRSDQLNMESLGSAPISKDASLRRNAAEIWEFLAENKNLTLRYHTLEEPQVEKRGHIFWPYINFWPYTKVLNEPDPDGQVRVATFRLLAAESEVYSPEMQACVAKLLISAWPKLDDDFQRSAAVGAASRNPAAVITAALDSADAASLTPLVSALTQNLTDAADAAKLVVALADKPASADALKRSILGTLGTSLKAEPAMTPELSSALGKLLASRARGSALPLVMKWDKAGALKSNVKKIRDSLFADIIYPDATEDERISAVKGYLSLRGTDAEIFPNVIRLLIGNHNASFTRQIITTLSETGDASVGGALAWNYSKLSADAQTVAFDTLLKRPEWALAFLDAVASKQVDVTKLGPANAARLRTYPNRAVSRRATQMLDELNPLAKAKKDAIAKLLPIVEQPGDAAKGKVLFNTTCALCHKFGGFGADIGPGLTGMGAHGANELLTAIVDPNAEVDPSFTQWDIETKDGGAFAGVIASENPATITLKSLAGVQQIKVKDIRTRVNTGRSLMPEGFEGLGAEALRDIIAYMQSVDGGKFRVVDLHDAFTTTTALGIYASQEAKDQSFVFKKTGNVNVEGVPFSVVGPDKAPQNIVVLRGGPGNAYSKTLPQKVEVKLGGFKANRLHFLGGVTGWGYNNGGDTGEVLQIIVHFTDGNREGIVCRNGTEFADYIRRIDVPGSKFVDLVQRHQMRYFVKTLAHTGQIERITLESSGAGAAPTIVAITAELAEGGSSTGSQAGRPAAVRGAEVSAGSASPAAPATVAGRADSKSALPEDGNFKPQFDDAVPQPPATRPGNGPRVLIVGGGSSHDFVKFFGGTDKATLAPVCGWVDFTQNANGVAPILDRVDVLLWSANQPVSSATKKALLAYANRGGAIIAHHPGTWYAWKNFPEWNAQIVGGGAHGHDKLGPYTVKVTEPAHPIMKGVPASFEITDELYNYTPDPAGTPIEVLAEATSPKSGKTFPQVFIVKHPKARIVGITLGHDDRAHDLPAYQALLRNTVLWAAGK